MTSKIGIITKNVSFFSTLKALRRSDTQYEMELIKTLTSLTQVENAGKLISSFIFDSTHTVDDILEFGKYINRSKHYKSSSIFLAFENFETFQSITIDDTFKNATIINMPATAEEIYLKLTTGTSNTVTAESKTNLEVKPTKGTNNAAFLNIFIESTVATFKEMTTCEDVITSPPGLLDYKKLESSIAIRGKLAIDSPHFVGSFFISFPEKTFLNVCTRILYEEVTKIDKENEDLVSELCNIIYGKSKVLIAKLDMKMKMVIPTYNRDPKVVSSASVLVVKLNSELGEFYIKVAPGLL
jgi:CheY-specific phosphatase CheX